MRRGAMPQIGDKLLCSFGQDLLASLNTTMRFHAHSPARVAVDSLLTLVYVGARSAVPVLPPCLTRSRGDGG